MSADPPVRLGRYVLVRRLAAGGMATLHLARVAGPAGFEKLVAIKTIHPHLAHDQELIRMFLDEARLASMIDHPNVCTVFDFGSAQGSYYIAMEYLLGAPLSDLAAVLVKRRDVGDLHQLPFFAAAIFADACEGLHAAHELVDSARRPLNVVHRDVTPHNLFVTFSGSIKLLDFGIAKAEQRIQHTRTGSIKGKLAYLAPETVDGFAPDRRVDLWSLGVCMWEFLCVKRLFRHSSEGRTLMAVISDSIPLPSKVRAWNPPELDDIVLRALERDPSRRYQTARALGRDLRHFLTRSGHTFGLADQADFMRRLLPDELVQQQQLYEETLSGQQGTSFDAEPTKILPDVNKEPATRRRSGLWLGGFALLLLVGVWQVWTGFVSSSSKVDLSRSETPGEILTQVGGQPEAPNLIAASVRVDAAAVVASKQDAAPADLDGTTSLPPTAPLAGHAHLPLLPAKRPSFKDPVAEDPPPRPGRQPRRRPRRKSPLDVPPPPPAPRAVETAPLPTGPRPAVPRSARGATGTIRVRMKGGWAKVFIDDIPQGRTPIDARLPAGSHSVRMLPFGEKPAYSQDVELFRDSVSTVAITVENE